ncbi:MAG TPA: transcription termination factor NusA [Dehalococcoidia bacterium]|nr:transcription termination factor NusA [Dehalococcoidia bacterium]
MKSDFLIAITQLAAEKNLPREVVLQAVEAALVSAYKKDSGLTGNVVVHIDREKGSVNVYQRKNVVAEVIDPKIEMTVQEAREFKAHPSQDDVIDIEVTPANAGRIAAQTAKQVVLQRLRDAERQMVFEEFSTRESDIVSGVIQRLDGHNVVIDLGKTEGILPPAEQVRGETYRPGQRMKFYLMEVHRSVKGPQLILSRTHKNLLKRLFELEVPEIYNGTVEINAIAREPGYRSKVAVGARQEGVDPVGSCVGLRGIRIQNIVNELNGERIDVVQWDSDTSHFVANALSPAQVLQVTVNDEENTASVVVPDRQLSLAIGKEGQNARLAAKLTGWRIDIKPESAVSVTRPLTPPEPVAAEPAPAAPARKSSEAPDDAEIAPWAEVIDEDEAATEVEQPAPAVASEPQPATAGGEPAIRFAEDIFGKREDKKAKKAAKKGEKEGTEVAGKAKRAKKQRPLALDEDTDVLDEDIAVPEAEPEAEEELAPAE